MIVVDASVLTVALIDDGSDGVRVRTVLSGQALAAPELIDLTGESLSTLEAYGLNRQDKTGFQSSFARNCLMARRLVERGVRFVTLFLSPHPPFI